MDNFFRIIKSLLVVFMLVTSIIRILASNELLKCEQDSTDDSKEYEKMALSLASKGEYKESVIYWDKVAYIQEQSADIDIDELSLTYAIIMELAPKARLFNTEAKYAQKYSRLLWPQITFPVVKSFEMVEKQAIDAFLKAKDNNAAIREINYTDSCISSIEGYEDINFRQILKIKKNIANSRYDLAYKESLLLFDFLKNDSVDNDALKDMRDIADAMINVCDYEKAINIMKKVYDISKKDIDSKRDNLLKIGNYYFLAKDYKNADYFYEESYFINHLKANRETDWNEEKDGVYVDDDIYIYDGYTSEALFYMSLVSYKLGNIDKGDLLSKEYLRKIEQYGKKFVGDYVNRQNMLEITRHEALGDFDEAIKLTQEIIKSGDDSFGDLSELLSLLYLSSNQIEEAFILSTDIIQKKRQFLLNNFDALTYEEKHRLWNGNSDIFKIQKIAALLSDNPFRTDMLYNDVAIFSKGLLLNVSTNSDYRSILQATWKDIQKKLKKNELAIEFIAVERIDQNPDSLVYLAISIDNKCEHPTLYNLCLANELTGARDNTELYKSIWGKLGINNHIKSIYFSADGIMHKLPLEALLHSYMSEDIKIYRLTSTRELLRKSHKRYNKKSILYGGLTYNDTNYHGRELRYSMDEVFEIEKCLRKSGQECVIYKGDDGTCESYLSLNNQYLSFLHLATHGFIDKGSNKDNSMMYSGLVMSDRKISSEEISKIKFNGLKLVVLSACGSGLGEITNGEGVFGLQRAFKQAGASSLLMTLWDIDDSFTRLLMVKFYSKICKGKSFQKALHESQCELKNHYVPEYGHPYSDEKIWAGFVLLDAL